MSLSASIRKRRAGGFALEVDFSVPSGITMLFGESGSGKTTVLRCIAGLLRPDPPVAEVAPVGLCMPRELCGRRCNTWL